ncbi:hypothetical protein JM18_003926 [Phytophthora kernoviae]|uniref:SMC hinge domain-containing protein n=2 Tax=Phytophthora kernoviae TaxID=325452 RepID=A0A8T0LZJ3_9STRA|nr:hypothetical protein G195_005000 [Phytophthora kernoviae 00238/432]KAG2525493.1 hypothetical protein JM16_004391 [Phytophthora kernoviae]KAG2527254.1 hypothetical protein JM18_003926 [Phytophthora kernoviae]
MHIKQVIVCGFRSYKDQVAVEPFSKQHNVVIGRNGTGKSNFFDAIRFGLLTSRFANLRPDERQALLHEGSGKHVMSAYVEIVFDNSDGRLPVDDSVVTLRRTIGVKKDEFFLNRKHITKSDVVHLLESAGFSRSNPYYIVQQGKVNALAVMRERERLELLKEVAGTKVYEDQRVKSLKILQDTQSQRDKIQEVVRYIEERLSELEEEKEELKEYQQLDREQRALEYTMHDKELQKVREELEALDRQQQQESAMSTDLHEQLMHVRAEISRIESNHRTKKQDLAQLVEDKKDQESERKELMEARYKLEMEVEELQEQIRTDGVHRSAASKEVEMVKREIEAKRAKLANEILPAFQQAEHTHDQVTRNLQECQVQSEHLIAKQSRTSQFRTQQERDAYLQREISDIERLVRRKESDTASLRYSIEGLAHSIEGSERTLKQQMGELREHRRQVDSIGEEVLRLKEQRNDMNEERKEKWREENQISYDVRELKKKLSDGENSLQSTMAYDVRRGLQAVRDMQSHIRGIYGPLIELVRPVDERYCIAVDEAGGGALFHVVVDTDDTAAKIMRELEKKNLGRLTFLPLNRLKVKDHHDYPQNDDVVPIVDKLEFPTEVRKAVMTAFGKKLLCRDLDTRESELAGQLGEGVEGLAISERDENLKAKQIDLANASRLVDDNTSLLKQLELKIETLQQEITNENTQMDTLNGEDISVSDQIQQEARRTEKVMNKRRRLLKKREDTTKDIRELGTLPMSELEKFKVLSYQEVLKQFKRRNEKLKKYSHVNKKALDQFMSFSEQRTTLLDRKKEIDDAYNSIKDLIDVLDKRKDEAIFRTFKGVAGFFAEVFRELVPTGEGKMILVGADTSQTDGANGVTTPAESGVDTYSGVQIKVNFRGEGDSYLMQQLSGGQKALVALAFIFAIQRVDPAPFYLFDEIDQALDSTHRAAVAALIHRQAHSKDSPAQFITSTFRPELVNIADKFYGIGYQNKISNVYSMQKEESLDFISNIMAEEEGVAGA